MRFRWKGDKDFLWELIISFFALCLLFSIFGFIFYHLDSINCLHSEYVLENLDKIKILCNL